MHIIHSRECSRLPIGNGRSGSGRSSSHLISVPNADFSICGIALALHPAIASDDDIGVFSNDVIVFAVTENLGFFDATDLGSPLLTRVSGVPTTLRERWTTVPELARSLQFVSLRPFFFQFILNGQDFERRVYRGEFKDGFGLNIVQSRAMSCWRISPAFRCANNADRFV